MSREVCTTAWIANGCESCPKIQGKGFCLIRAERQRCQVNMTVSKFRHFC